MLNMLPCGGPHSLGAKRGFSSQSYAMLMWALGVSDKVMLVNEYLSLPELTAYIQSCDVFVTPYPGKDQIASGTMAYAMATVGAIVSTPYLCAEDVLAEGSGRLIPFANDGALADAILRYLTEPGLMAATRRRAHRYAQSMLWPHVGRQYLDVFAQAAGKMEPHAHPGACLPTNIGLRASARHLLTKH